MGVAVGGENGGSGCGEASAAGQQRRPERHRLARAGVEHHPIEAEPGHADAGDRRHVGPGPGLGRVVGGEAPVESAFEQDLRDDRLDRDRGADRDLADAKRAQAE